MAKQEKQLPPGQFRTRGRIQSPLPPEGFDPTKYELVDDPKPEPQKPHPFRHKLAAFFLNKYSATLLVLAIHFNPTDLGTTVDVRIPNPVATGSARFNLQVGDLRNINAQANTDPNKNFDGATVDTAFTGRGIKLNLDTSSNILKDPVEVRWWFVGISRNPTKWGFKTTELPQNEIP